MWSPLRSLVGWEGSRGQGPVPRIHVDEEEAELRLGRVLRDCLAEPWRQKQEILFLCIGTDRSTGDALGPLAGSQLAALEGATGGRVRVQGTLDAPVHASNLHEVVRTLREAPERPYVVAIDACLGRAENVGCLTVRPGPLLPGTGVNKTLPPVGDLQVLGVVNVGGFMEYFVLQNTRLSAVMRMVEVVSVATWHAISWLAAEEGFTLQRPPGLLGAWPLPCRSPRDRRSNPVLPESLSGAAVTRVADGRPPPPPRSRRSREPQHP